MTHKVYYILPLFEAIHSGGARGNVEVYNFFLGSMYYIDLHYWNPPSGSWARSVGVRVPPQ